MSTTTPEQEKDFKEVVTVIIVAIALILLLVYVYPLVYTYVFGQVDVKQSITTNTNGKTTSISTSSGTTTLKLSGVPGTIKLTEGSGAVTIKYCVHHQTSERCKLYSLYYNGTITEVKQSK
jgi:FlaG/FlaF family flagellin (archaellin)